MPGSLPSLKALRAFEAAARHLSFSRASRELHVTPAAISQQIKLLEAELGLELFERRNRSLALSDAGRLLLPEIREGFDSFSRAMQRLRGWQGRRVIKLASAPAFASKWLVANLDRFSASQNGPKVDVYVFAGHALIDYALESIDIGIRYGQGGYAGLVSEPLLPDSIFPVCSPSLLEGANAPRIPDDLARQTLLHDDSLRFDSTFPDWPDWLKRARAGGVAAQAGPRFSTASDAIEAAIRGAGILLARESLVGADIATGKLVRLFAINYPLKHGFHIVYRPGALERPEVRAFRDWLMEAIRNRTV